MVNTVCRRTKKLKVNFISFGWFLFFVLPSLKFYAIQLNDIADLIFDLWGIISCLLLLSIVLPNYLMVIPKGIIYLLIFVLFYLFSTVLFSGFSYIAGAISESARIIILPLYLILLKVQGWDKKRLSDLRTVFLIILFIDSFLTFISVSVMQIFEEGTQYSLLGLDNYSIFTIVPMLTIVMYISSNLYGKVRITDWFAFFCCFVSKILTFAVTSILSLSVMLLAVIIFRKLKSVRRHISLTLFFIFVILLIIGIVFFNFLDLFVPVLNFFGKDTTLSFRTVIWDKTINSILYNPIFGYGKIPSGKFQEIVGLSPILDLEANHPHNFILSILFSTGIVGFFLLLGMLRYADKSIKRATNDFRTSYILAGFLAFICLMITDDYITSSAFYVMVTFAILMPIKEENNKDA